MYFKISVLLMVVIAVTAERSNSALPSQLTGKVLNLMQIKTVYAKALAYVSKDGKFLIGSTILREDCALTLRFPHFNKYTAKTNCDGLKLVAGTYSNKASGEVCDISKIEPVTELKTDPKKGPRLVLITLKTKIFQTQIPVIQLLTQHFQNPTEVIKLEPVTFIAWDLTGKRQVIENLYFKCSEDRAIEVYTDPKTDIGRSCMGGFAIYQKKLFAIAESCEFEMIQVSQPKYDTLTINLINLHLRLGFINERIKTDSSTTGILKGSKNDSPWNKEKDHPKE